MRKILFLFFALFFSFGTMGQKAFSADFSAKNISFYNDGKSTYISGEISGDYKQKGKIFADFSFGANKFRYLTNLLPNEKPFTFKQIIENFVVPNNYKLSFVFEREKLISDNGLPKIVWHGYKFLASNQTEAEYELQNVDKANIIFECASSKDDLEKNNIVSTDGKYFAQSYPDIKSNIKSKAICKVSKNTNGEVFSRLCAAANAVTYCTETKVLK